MNVQVRNILISLSIIVVGILIMILIPDYFIIHVDDNDVNRYGKIAWFGILFVSLIFNQVSWNSYNNIGDRLAGNN